MLTNNRTIFRKLRFEYIRIDPNKTPKAEKLDSLIKNSKESQRITVKTYKEEINDYEISSTYYKNIKRLKFDLKQMGSISFQNKTIYKVCNSINKGVKIILIELEDNFQ